LSQSGYRETTIYFGESIQLTIEGPAGLKAAIYVNDGDSGE